MASAETKPFRAVAVHLFAGAAVVGFIVAGVGGWAATTQLAGAVASPGVVVVSSNVKKVQHPIGGIVKELLVHNGDFVRAGQVVVRLDDTQARSELAIHIKRNDELLARQARLEAELAGADTIDFPEELTRRSTEPGVALLMAGEGRLLNIRREAIDGLKAQLRERVAQLEHVVTGLQAQADAKKKEIEWVRQELEGIMSLWQKNFVQFNRVVALQRDVAKANGDHGELIASMAEANNKIAETELQIIQVDEDLRSEVGKELATVRADLAVCTERKVAAEDVFSRIEIRAPQDGTVHEMSVSTVGGVIAAGEEIMQVVPAHDTLDVWAKVPPDSIDQVHVGQTAYLRFAAFDQGATPEIKGTVTVVSADLVEDEKTDERYYSIRISIPQRGLKDLGLILQPGMPVEAFIRTDDRTVISYLVKPLNDQITKAFRER
jgi:HlyD family secretion protein